MLPRQLALRAWPDATRAGGLRARTGALDDQAGWDYNQLGNGRVYAVPENLGRQRSPTTPA